MATPATPAPLHPPSPPSHTPVVDFALIERQKENIQPLRNGRSASALQSVFSAPRPDRAATLSQGHAKYRAEIAAVEEAEAGDGYDDPLDAYVKYVKWVVDSYPAGQTAESGIVPLIERATRRFKDDPRYKGDLRYLKLWVSYAGYVNDPKVIYQFLLANEIGTHYALLYEEYAGVLERSGSRAQADEMFQLGIARKAQPVNRLPSRYSEFQKRMMHAPAAATPTDGAVTNAPGTGRRQALVPRSLSSTNPLVPNGPATNPAAHLNSGISVFVDEENTDPSAETNEWPDAGTKASRIKENTQYAGQWKGEKLKMRGPAVTGHGATPARKVDVYQDGDEALTKTPSHPAPEDIFSRSLKPSEDQMLRHNPFKNYSPTPAPPSLLATALRGSVATVHPTEGASQVVLSFSEPRKMDEPFAPQPFPEKARLIPRPSKSGKLECIRMDLGQMYKDGFEWSLDEMRARRRGMLNKVWEEEVPASSSASSAVPAPADMEDVLEPLKDEAGPGARREAERERNTMRLDAPTVNTRAALDDVYGLFNTSPSKSDQDGPTSPVNSPPVAHTPSMVAPKQNENATARKVSGPFSSARTPFNAFVGSSGIMATPTPAQGSLGRSASGRSLLELHVEEPHPEPEKTPHKVFEIFTESTATVSRSVAKKTAFEVFVEEQPAPPKTPAQASYMTMEKKTFAIFVDPELDAPKADVRRESTSPPTTTDRRAFVPFVDPVPESTGTQAEHEEHSEAPSLPLPSRELSIFTEASPSAAATEKPKLLSFIHEEADVKTVVSPQSHEPTARAFIPFIDSPEQSRKATVVPDLPVPRPSGLPRPKPVGFSLPPRPDLGPLRTAAAELEAEDEEEEEPQTPWSEADEERWIVQQEQERQARRNARLGNFNIMTPITERTCEFTQMGSVVGQDDFQNDDDQEDAKSRGDIEHPDTGRWSEYVTAEQKVVGEFEVSITDKEVTQLAATVESLAVNDVSPQIKASALASGIPPNPCNPFDPSILEFLLSHLSPIDSHPNFCDLRLIQANKMDGLQKHGKKMARKSGNTTTALVEDRYPITLGKDTYDVKEKLGEGGFGAVFLAQFEKSSQDDDDDDDDDLLDDDEEDERLVAIKAERPCNLWESIVLQRIQEALPQRLRESVIRPRSMYAYADESFLVLDFCQQGTLLDAVNQSSMANSGTANMPGMDELLVMFFSVELVRLVEGLHTAGFIHGDMKIDNCLVRLDDVPGGASAWSSAYSRSGDDGWSHKGIRMIDFGRAIDTRLFPADQQFIADWPTDERDCVEMRENRPWTYQSDYFGLASIVYCLLFGKYIETSSSQLESDPSRKRYKIASPLKRYWQCELWTRLFDLLLNPCLVQERGILPVTAELAAVREDMEAWLEANCDKTGKSLKGLLKKVELAALGKKRRY